jgi:signal transduction histidine kinase
MRSIQKITLLLIFTISTMLILFGSSIYYFQYNYAYSDFYKRLETRIGLTAKYSLNKDELVNQSLKKFRAEHLEKLSYEKEYIFPYNESINIENIAQENNLPINFLNDIRQNKFARYQNYDIFYAGSIFEEDKGKYIVIISAKNYYATHHLILLRNVLIAGLLISVFIITYLSYYFSKRIFKPIDKIIKKVNNISSDNIHLRLEEIKDDAEINQLISTFNNLLDRIETTFETHKNFISNASHEFNTPLTTIIGEADVALLKERSIEEYQEVIQRILNQAERLDKISKSLLFLAQTGYKENRLSFNIIRTDELIVQSKELMDELIPKNNIQINFNFLPENPLKLKINGNKELLLLAFTNILSNSCKYSNNKSVLVSLASTGNEVIIVFKDQGIGIPPSEMQFIYDPFYRASNTKAYEGYGIGLPLTRNIIRIHQGILEVKSVEQQGVTVQIKLPVAVL